MPRPSKWNSKTTAIRVPEHAADQLLAIARQIDAQCGFVQNPEPLGVTIEDNATTERYILLQEPLTEDEQAIIDQAISSMQPDLNKLRPDERLLLFASLVQACMAPIEQINHSG